MRIPFLAASLLVGCGDASAPEETGAAETGAADTVPEDTAADAPDCPTLSAEACSSAPTCLTIDGHPTQTTDDGYCVEYAAAATTLGCRDEKSGCGDAPYLAAPATDPEDCWWFPNTCLPLGWVKCGGFDKWPECEAE